MAQVLKDAEGRLILRSDWWQEDFEQVAENMGVQLSPDQVEGVMELIADRFDANIGINWQVLEDAIQWYMQGEKACA